jgi:hypothetical protein
MLMHIDIRSEIKMARGRLPDAVEIFRARAEARAQLYAASELDLDDAVDWDEADPAVRMLRAVDAPYDDDPNDDYAGLTHSFARLCRAADAEHKSNANIKGPTKFHIAASTLAAAEYLIKQNDPTRMCTWLAGRSDREVEAIWQHIKKKGGT